MLPVHILLLKNLLIKCDRSKNITRAVTSTISRVRNYALDLDLEIGLLYFLKGRGKILKGQLPRKHRKKDTTYAGKSIKETRTAFLTLNTYITKRTFT